MGAEDRRNRNEQIKEALDLRPRIDRYAGWGLALGPRVRERVPAVDTGAVGG
jgi:hypothetical protein